MILGAISFVIYGFAARSLLLRFKYPASKVTLSLLPVWIGVALGLWFSVMW